MAGYPSYNRVDPFSPLGADAGAIHRSPGSYSQTWGTYHGDLGSPEIELHESPRPQPPVHNDSEVSNYSTSSTLFPSKAQRNSETESFLQDPFNKIDHTFTTNSYVPYKDHTGRQLRHILIGSSSRWFITAALCAGYALVTAVYQHKGIQSEKDKKIYNTIATAISIALSLNVASAFKDMALNMRWPILSSKKRNLAEIDLILHADSMTKLAKLAFVSRRPLLIFACASWLFINILAQAGIAMLSLTYSWETDFNAVLLHPGNVSIPDMGHFYPWGDNQDISIQGEEFTAHLYGGLAYNNGINETRFMPQAGDIYKDTIDTLWNDDSQNMIKYVFADSPTGVDSVETFSVYTNRTINVTYICEAHKVTSKGNGTSNYPIVEGIGEVYVSHTVEESMTFFTNMVGDWPDQTPNYCENNNTRCSIVEVFESSYTDPWYYKCNMTMGKTMNDTLNITWISDDMAFMAASAIAQIGYSDSTGQEAQIYPKDSMWGYPLEGNVTDMGQTVATFALGSISGAAMYNPFTSYKGMAPSSGAYLKVGHTIYFYLIIGLICGCHLLFCTIVAVLANRVMVGPDGHLAMSLLLRPIADSLEGVSGGRQNNAYKEATKKTEAKYEKARNGRWVLAMT